MAHTRSLRSATLNDQQSRLNRTAVVHLVLVQSEQDVSDALRLAASHDLPVAVCAGRHAMGGQQFARCGVVLDMTRFSRVRAFDEERGRVTVEAGAYWPSLMEALDAMQLDAERPWAIRQKQTGVDRVSIGGSLAANAHGRGLRMPPLVDDCESLTLMDAEGQIHHCDRDTNAELFSLAIGGYGGFGVILTATLRLTRRQTLCRHVEAIPVADLIERATDHYNRGALYGDCQFATHLEGDAKKHPGILSCYRPTDGSPDPEKPGLSLSTAQWTDLVQLARADKRRAFAVYRDHYLKTDGQRYASDRHQCSPVFEGYLAAMSARGKVGHAIQHATEVITEVYVDPANLMPFLAACRSDSQQHGVDITYGTIRLIEPDHDTYLPWATQRWACIVVNLHVKHNPAGLAKAKRDFRRILDRALAHGGSFYLTYHRWAQRRHLDAAYPQMAGFLRHKQRYDPAGRFVSDWYRHLMTLYPEVA